MDFIVNTNNYDKLVKRHERMLKDYEISIFILENIKLLKKKDGTDFKDIKKTFDIEDLKSQLEKKYNCKMGCGSCVYLIETEFDFEIHFSINNFSSTVYVKKKVYADDLSQEEREKNAYRIRKDSSITRAYYNIDTVDEIKKYINIQLNDYKKFAEDERKIISNLPKLKKLTQKYLDELEKSGAGFGLYRDDVASLIGY